MKSMIEWLIHCSIVYFMNKPLFSCNIPNKEKRNDCTLLNQYKIDNKRAHYFNLLKKLH